MKTNNDNEDNCVPEWVDDILPTFYNRRSEEELKKKQDARKGIVSTADPHPYALKTKNETAPVSTASKIIPEQEKINGESEFHQFLFPTAGSVPALKEYTLNLQGKYLKAGFPLFPVDNTNNACIYPFIPTRNPEGLKTTENISFYQNRKNVKMFRAIIPANTIVIDLDRKNGKDGLKVFNDWLSEKEIKTGLLSDIEHGSHPVTTRTGSGGFHLYFQLPTMLQKTKSCPGGMEGVDFLLPGYQIVTAGSQKQNGNIYIPNFESLDQLPTLPFPIALFLLYKKDEENARKLSSLSKAEERKNNGILPDKTAEMILNWRLKAWDEGKTDYAGHNDFFAKAVAECKMKGIAPQKILQAIKNCDYFKTWEDIDKESQICQTIKALIGKNPNYKGEYNYGDY